MHASEAQSFDLRGMTLLPGLIDAHVHVTAVTADLARLAEWSPAYVTARAAGVLMGMLRRGFTTVRDVGGAEYGLAQALEEGYLEGPRLVFGGKALSQTGGHGDFRGQGRHAYDRCHCCPSPGVICDGVEEVRKAAREEIRRGASHLKLMLSGGSLLPPTALIRFSSRARRFAPLSRKPRPPTFMSPDTPIPRGPSIGAWSAACGPAGPRARAPGASSDRVRDRFAGWHARGATQRIHAAPPGAAARRSPALGDDGGGTLTAPRRAGGRGGAGSVCRSARC